MFGSFSLSRQDATGWGGRDGSHGAHRNLGVWQRWVLARVLALLLGGASVWFLSRSVFFDTTYYADWARGTLNGSRIPYRDFAWEYPPGALPAMLLPGLYAPLLSAGPHHAYHVAFGVGWAVLMLAVDGSLMRLIVRRTGGVRQHPATTLWIYGPPLLGALCWARYDLLPAVASAAAVVAAGRARVSKSAGLAGLGGAFKIWPLLLAPVQRTRRAAVQATAIGSAVVVGTAAITFGLTGSVGFDQVLSYQSRRGLQCESFAALPFVWLRHFGVSGYTGHFQFGASEVLGPGVAAAGLIVTGLYALGLVALGLAHWRFMRADAGPNLVALTAVCFICLTLLTNKVFSPQYLLWLLAVTAAACVLDPVTWKPYVPWLLVVCALTDVVFPWFYSGVNGTSWFGLLVATARDLILLVGFFHLARKVLRELQGSRHLEQPAQQESLVTPPISSSPSPS